MSVWSTTKSRFDAPPPYERHLSSAYTTSGTVESEFNNDPKLVESCKKLGISTLFGSQLHHVADFVKIRIAIDVSKSMRATSMVRSTSIESSKGKTKIQRQSRWQELRGQLKLLFDICAEEELIPNGTLNLDTATSNHTSTSRSDGSNNSAPRIVKAQNVCANCCTTQGHQWRRGINGGNNCLACHLYYKRHNCPRPVANFRNRPSIPPANTIDPFLEPAPTYLQRSAYSNTAHPLQTPLDSDPATTYRTSIPRSDGSNNSAPADVDMARVCVNCGTTRTPGRSSHTSDPCCDSDGPYYTRPITFSSSPIHSPRPPLLPTDGSSADPSHPSTIPLYDVTDPMELFYPGSISDAELPCIEDDRHTLDSSVRSSHEAPRRGFETGNSPFPRNFNGLTRLNDSQTVLQLQSPHPASPFSTAMLSSRVAHADLPVVPPPAADPSRRQDGHNPLHSSIPRHVQRMPYHVTSVPQDARLNREEPIAMQPDRRRRRVWSKPDLLVAVLTLLLTFVSVVGTMLALRTTKRPDSGA